MIAPNFLPLLALAGLVAAHAEKPLSPHEHARRQLETRDRHFRARRCLNHISEFTAKRKAKRSLAKRGLLHQYDSTTTLDLPPPHHTGLPPDFNCVTAPETLEGPYYINNEMVRYDLTESQGGVELFLDIGALDINTCEPLENVFVELWSANATGIYSSYQLDVPDSPDDQVPLIRNETYLRGGLSTDKNGIVELKTIYPGFYWPRAPHIHVMMHSNWEMSSNGTVISHSGNVVHVGQIYFEESWNDKVYAIFPYNASKNDRILNDDDWVLQDQLKIQPEGYSAFVELELVGEQVKDGLVGYMTLGVDTTASYPIKNTNYYNSSTDAEVDDATKPMQQSIDPEAFFAVQMDGELL
ncbi:hypothetical protein VKT23_012486 [Stygiomarasmius scandens]|uniref:Intradiol ring-cleavage dioxygenases domain-containing protein n=1 Tax=Marasmiellus scandens TaxID=2682957 RepID=A0ABR1J8T9_9AGAR